MLGEDLVRPLEVEWQAALDRVLAGYRTSTADVARLGPKLAKLSQAYNAGEAEGAKTKLPLEARIAFSFPRDVPKGAAAVRELVATGALTLPLRVVDVGAGLGAMTWGLVRALAAAGLSGAVEALLVDEDAEVLRAAEAIAKAAPRGPVSLNVTTRKASVEGFEPPAADVVFLGQVLSELDRELEAEARVLRHAAVLERLAAAGRTLVVVEPALRDRTRHLHAVRDRLVPSLGVFAPCLHARACPALQDEHAWCHEDLDVDLPAWVVPLARAAGLRYQRLTFSYLVLRKDGKRLPPAGFRVVSERLTTKGKTEIFACTCEGTRPRLRQLDRDAARSGGPTFAELRRGDLVTVSEGGTAGVAESGRVNANATIDVHFTRR